MKIRRNLVSLMLILGALLGLNAQPKYDFTKLQREELGRGVVLPRRQDGASLYE